MQIILPEDVKVIIRTLTENGFEAYAVGGCVRDSIIRRVPGDWDITTSALPEQVKQLFRRTIDTGIVHGTVTVMIGKTGYEVTTYRIDGEYEDGRHPKQVEYTSSLREDLCRRDFTINAMAYNDEDGIVDMFQGKEDIENKIIRCVGEAKERFTEDALRMLRAVRFSAQLGFEIDSKTEEAIIELAPTIEKISKERIHTELNKTLLSSNPDYIVKARKLGITKVVFPVVDELIREEEAMKLLKNLPKDIVYRYAAIMYQLGGERAGKMLKELKLDNYTIDNTVKLVSLHGLPVTEEEVEIRKQASKAGREMYERILLFEKSYYDVIGDFENKRKIELQTQKYNEINARGECLNLKELSVTGNDLIKAGVAPGKEMGMLLNKMLNHVLEQPEDNQKEILFKKFL